MLKQEQINGKVLNHLGLVMAVIKKIGIIDKVDKRLAVSVEKGAKITMGERVAAMVLNGLGFTDDRLYMFAKFLENKPLDRLFRKGVAAADFTDDALARCLDAIYNYGVTKLFSELAFDIGIQFNLLGKTARFDTTSLTVYGQYQEEEKGSLHKGQLKGLSTSQEEDKAHPAYGYSKDGRNDLKQMILNLATTGIANLPIWMSAHSGNVSDKNILQQAAERMKNFADALQQAPCFLFVGDSAMYEKCVERAGSMLWLSRVPHVLKQAKQVLSYGLEELAFTSLEKGYQVSKTLYVDYKGKLQRWVVVYSQQKHKKEMETLNKKISQEAEKFSKQLWHLSNQIYACKKDAHQGLKPLIKSLNYHEISFELEAVEKHGQVGRPKAAASKEIVGYKIKGSLVVNKEAIAKKEKEAGKFILATNQMNVTSLSEESMLDQYKQQTQTERGFRFIKADAFEVSSIFLKKPSRIEALMMIMTLCLMTYNLSEHFLAQELASKREYISNQLSKPVQRPSMAYIYRLFEGIQVLSINFGTYLQEIVTNLVEELRRIISYFGPVAEEIYGMVA